MNKIRVAVVCGGKSTEHEVSVVSAKSVMDAMDKEKYDVVKVFIGKDGAWSIDDKPFNPWDLPKVCDFVLPILHGINGEDGTIQGLFELLNIPYGGCGVLGCATAMDKTVAKYIFETAGLKQTPYVAFTAAEIGPKVEEEINAKLKYPVFVKPVNMGSSVGITKVVDPSKLHDAIVYASKFDSRFVVEQGVNCRELEVAVMGNDELFVGAVGEIRANDGFYDYDEKYNKDTSELLIPAPITQEQKEKIQELAKIAYKSLGCCGFARVDFMMDKDTEEIFINEINAIPGFTSISMFPKLCIEAGYTYSGIIDRIVELGYERYNAKNNRQNC